METKRLILFVVFSFSLLLLWDSWQREQAPMETSAVTEKQLDASIPSSSIVLAGDEPISNSTFQLAKSSHITVTTDLYNISISNIGGDIRSLELLKHKDAKGAPYLLMSDKSSPLLYVAQTGLLGEGLPTHKDTFLAMKTSYQMSENELEVPLVFENSVVKVNKTYKFTKNSYVINVAYSILNKSNNTIKSSTYLQFIHDGTTNQGSAMMPSFTGTAYFNDEDKFTKLAFDDVNKKPFSLITNNGWIGIIQRYFVGAWILPPQTPRELYSKKVAENIYASGTLASLGELGSGDTKVFTSELFVGPQSKDDLKAAAEGLSYTVDYGWLTFIASPLFSVLSGIQKAVINWGVAIILLTILIKLLFYPLSAASYRSMAQMREVAPRLQSMKEKFGDDKQKMQQAMMELYKTEKINPLGGCLPILVQIPVFIALYWVLLGSVELRGAPFLYIGDLSVPDSLFGTLWFVPLGPLPLLMAASMFLQMKLNPKPTDPMQARLMMMMPIIFSVFFFFFPSGLVLYWLVNNILSIGQQWYVNNKIHAEALKKKGNA